MADVNAREYALVFSLNKQANIHWPVANNKMTKMRMLRSFAAMTEQRQNISDGAWFGKGHPFPTFVDPVTKMYTIPATDRSASSLDLLHAAAYVLGDVTTSQPSSAFAEYQHEIVFQDVSVNREVLYTSFGEAMGTEYKKILSGAWINSFTITGNRNDHVILNFEGNGRLYGDGTFTTPSSVTAASFFKTLYGTVSFGASGGEADISAEVMSFNLTVSQAPDPLFLMGNSSGEEMLLSKVLIGSQSVSGSVVIRVNETHRNRFLDTDQVGCTITLKSPDLTVAGANQHSCAIELPYMYIMDEAFGVEGSTVVYTMNFPDGAVLKSGANEPITMTFVSDIDDTDLLVAA